MTFRNESKDGRAVIEVKGSLMIADAVSLHQELINCFKNNESVILDLKGVDDLDIAGMQLLISACKTAEKEDQMFSIEGMTDAAINAVKRAGMKPEMLCRKYLTGFGPSAHS